jgi:hypothetical protein
VSATASTAEGTIGRGESVPSLHQSSIVPAYPYNDYNNHGRTLEETIVALKSTRSLQGLYVTPSRVKSLQVLAVLGDFNPKLLEKRISEVRNEFKPSAALDEQTRCYCAVTSLWMIAMRWISRSVINKSWHAELQILLS